jgi:membrane protease YdiL (CAAX protease family)
MQNLISFIFFLGFNYGLFFCLLLWARRQGAHRLLGENGVRSSSPVLLVVHGAGILLFGLGPLLLSQTGYLPVLNSTPFPIGATAVSVLLVTTMLFISPRLAVRAYAGAKPPLPHKQPSPFFLTAYFFLRILFIAAYEWWFRGVLLSGIIAVWGLLPAVCLNVALYTVLHTVNGKKEMLGCVPFGLLLCALCLWQGAVWPAIALHLALTIPYEITLLNKLKSTNRAYENFSHRRSRLHRA